MEGMDVYLFRGEADGGCWRRHRNGVWWLIKLLESCRRTVVIVFVGGA